MFSAEAVRLAAIEALSPTAANLGQGAFPTLAGGNVFDSRAAPLNAIDAGRDYTPVIAVFTREAQAAPRGEATDQYDYEARTVLEFVVELAAVSEDSDGAYVDAIAENDPRARVKLAALVAQIRWVLFHSEAGALFRRLVIRVERIEEEGHAVPEFGLRFQRVFLRFHLVIGQDVFSDDGGLPEPARSLAAKLPAQSYAKAMLDELAASFAGQSRTPLGSFAAVIGRDGLDLETGANND